MLADLPFLGEALFQQTAPTYLALALVGLAAWLLYRTPLGLAMRMVGENPHAARGAGHRPDPRSASAPWWPAAR